MSGTKAAGIGIPLELLFAPEAEAATIYDSDFTESELGRSRINEFFNNSPDDRGIATLSDTNQITLADLEARAKAEKEGPYDPYKSLGIATFPEYFFGTASAQERKNLENLKKSK